MPNDYPRQQEEDAQRRRAADVERRHDQRIRQERTELDQWRTAQQRQVSADAARRQKLEFERRRSAS